MAEGAIIAAIIGAGTTLYASSEQKKAQEEAQEKQDVAFEEAKLEEERILRETRPDDLTADATIQFGEGTTSAPGTTEEFLIPRTSSTLGATTGSGLGFKI